MTPKFHADHVGSFIRPQALLDTIKPWGPPPDENAKKAQQDATEAAVAHVVKKQLELDIRPITSGEYERILFIDGFFEKLQGMEVRKDIPIRGGLRKNSPLIPALERLGRTHIQGIVATGKIKRVTPAYLDAWKMLRSHVPEDKWKDCKITMPSPSWFHLFLATGGAYEVGAYSSDKEYFADLTAAYREELKDLYDAGLRSVQIDDPQLLYFIIDSVAEGMRSDGVDPAKLLDRYLWALNEIVRDRPKDMYVGIHMCRGNMVGADDGFLSGSYERIAEKIFEELKYDTFYLEFDDERAGSFEPLRFLPVGKAATLGLVTTKRPELENLEEMKAKVHRAAEAIATGQKRSIEEVLQDSLAVSPQCGFASAHLAKNVGSEERMWEKLVLVRDLARSIWKDSA
ncbi:hypothetical protein F5Y16DRAFT_378070 [Xylariaceae sp. FL0255]|nr:hypothetical protein F5Y16DRAFT_378070 [Xylariaceae sp. FL0255]